MSLFLIPQQVLEYVFIYSFFYEKKRNVSEVCVSSLLLKKIKTYIECCIAICECLHTDRYKPILRFWTYHIILLKCYQPKYPYIAYLLYKMSEFFFSLLLTSNQWWWLGYLRDHSLLRSLKFHAIYVNFFHFNQFTKLEMFWSYVCDSMECYFILY